jgi:glycosyltransferase involved in cell wall biosynthesis
MRVTDKEETFAPRAILEIELGDHSLRWKGDESTLQRDGALVLVRLHTKPIGVIEVSLGEPGFEHVFVEASKKLATLVSQHLEADEALKLRPGNSNGQDENELCLAERETLLKSAPSVSVVLATKNRLELANRCLDSIYQLDYPNFEVVVVDSSTGSDTKSLIEEHFPNVRYVRNLSGRVCVAKTRGAMNANGKYIAFTDDDAEVDRHWLSQLVLALEETPNAACATGFVMPLELDTQAQLWFEESGAFVEGIHPRRIGLSKVLERLGYFDIALDKCGAEDLAVFFDALCAGYEIVFEPGAIVWHQHRRTVEELRNQSLWHATGLGAYLTRCLVKEPRRTWDLVTRIPGGLRYGFAARSVRNRKKSKSFPREVTRQEWIGFLKGPAAYVTGALAARRTDVSNENRET